MPAQLPLHAPQRRALFLSLQLIPRPPATNPRPWLLLLIIKHLLSLTKLPSTSSNNPVSCTFLDLGTSFFTSQASAKVASTCCLHPYPDVDLTISAIHSPRPFAILLRPYTPRPLTLLNLSLSSSTPLSSHNPATSALISPFPTLLDVEPYPQLLSLPSTSSSSFQPIPRRRAFFMFHPAVILLPALFSLFRPPSLDRRRPNLPMHYASTWLIQPHLWLDSLIGRPLAIYLNCFIFPSPLLVDHLTLLGLPLFIPRLHAYHPRRRPIPLLPAKCLDCHHSQLPINASTLLHLPLSSTGLYLILTTSLVVHPLSFQPSSLLG